MRWTSAKHLLDAQTFHARSGLSGIWIKRFHSKVFSEIISQWIPHAVEFNENQSQKFFARMHLLNWKVFGKKNIVFNHWSSTLFQALLVENRKHHSVSPRRSNNNKNSKVFKAFRWPASDYKSLTTESRQASRYKTTADCFRNNRIHQAKSVMTCIF